eukprot:6492387-Amphidinium_carterae.2
MIDLFDEIAKKWATSPPEILDRQDTDIETLHFLGLELELTKVIGQVVMHQHPYLVDMVERYCQEEIQVNVTLSKRHRNRPWKLHQNRSPWSEPSSCSCNKGSCSLSFYFGSKLITWRSGRQQLVALSSAEAELIALCAGVQVAFSIVHQVQESRQGVVQLHAHCDNTAVIDIVAFEGGAKTQEAGGHSLRGNNATKGRCLNQRVVVYNQCQGQGATEALLA